MAASAGAPRALAAHRITSGGPCLPPAAISTKYCPDPTRRTVSFSKFPLPYQCSLVPCWLGKLRVGKCWHGREQTSGCQNVSTHSNRKQFQVPDGLFCPQELSVKDGNNLAM